MGFSLIGAAVVLGLTVFMAVEIITSNLLPSMENINDSYDDMNQRYRDQVHTTINITSVSRTANGSTFEYNISVKNIGSITLKTEGFMILLNGYECDFTASQTYIYPENTVHFRIENITGAGTTRIKVITNNGIADYQVYTG